MLPAGESAAEQVAADTGKAERPAAEASTAAAPVAAALASGDKSVGTVAVQLADELQPEVADKLEQLLGTEIATAQVVEVRNSVEAAAGIAGTDTERPAGSGSCTEPGDVGTVGLADATAVAEQPGAASESAVRC